MNIQNLTEQEAKQLQMLLGKLNNEPTEIVDSVDVMIEEILDEFNFARVSNVMGYIKWSGIKEAPAVYVLRENAERLLRNAATARLGEFESEHWEQGIHYATGGFSATAWCDEDKTKITSLNLEFILEEWRT